MEAVKCTVQASCICQTATVQLTLLKLKMFVFNRTFVNIFLVTFGKTLQVNWKTLEMFI